MLSKCCARFGSFDDHSNRGVVVAFRALKYEVLNRNPSVSTRITMFKHHT